jgi:prophage maintenance system killer protein
MAELHYLTVQDVLWINLQVTKKVQHFQYARLEEATFFQYAYGPTQGLFAQAARFGAGFVRLHPFDAGNAATAFVGLLAFVGLNGHVPTFEDDQALAWFRPIQDGKAGTATLESGFALAEHSERSPRTAIGEVLERYPCAVQTLSG